MEKESADAERRWRRSVTAGMGSEICFGGMAFRRTRRAWEDCFSDFEASVGVEPSDEGPGEVEGNTIPGESSSLSLLSIFTSRSEVVMPASAPTGHAVL